MQIKELISLITEKEIEYNLSKNKLYISRIKLKNIQKNLTELEKIKILILEISKQTKQDIKSYIENIVTNALQIVYGDEYSFEIHVESKKDQEEIYFYLRTKDGILLEPRKDTVAGGMLDNLLNNKLFKKWDYDSISMNISSEGFFTISFKDFLDFVNGNLLEFAKMSIQSKK